MPEPLFVVRNSAGSIVFDSRVAVAGCVGATVEVPPSVSQVYAFDAHVGRSAIVSNLTGRRLENVTVSTSLGYPVVTFAPTSGVRFAVIWIV